MNLARRSELQKERDAKVEARRKMDMHKMGTVSVEAGKKYEVKVFGESRKKKVFVSKVVHDRYAFVKMVRGDGRTSPAEGGVIVISNLTSAREL